MLLRIAFAWLLAVAIPLQGYAASRMLLCGPTHHPATVVERVLAPSQPADHLAAHAHVNAHSHVDAHAQTDRVRLVATDAAAVAPAMDEQATSPPTVGAERAAPAATTDAKSGHSAKSDHAGKCSACSSCCHSAALTQALITVPVVLPDQALLATLPPARERLCIGGLDRPPRLAAA